MPPAMPFDIWLNVCADLVALRYRLSQNTTDEFRDELQEVQRLLEDGRVEQATQLLEGIQDLFSLTSTPQDQAESIYIVAVLALNGDLVLQPDVVTRALVRK